MLNEHLVAEISNIAQSNCDLKESQKVYNKLLEVFNDDELQQLARGLNNPLSFCSHAFPAFIAGLYLALYMSKQNTEMQELDRLWKL